VVELPCSFDIPEDYSSVRIDFPKGDSRTLLPGDTLTLKMPGGQALVVVFKEPPGTVWPYQSGAKAPCVVCGDKA
jgi:hypothetical protein